VAPQDLWFKWEKVGDGKKRVRSARHGRGMRWRVNYTDPHTGEPRSPSFETKKEAVSFENKINAEIDSGQYLDPNAGKQLVPAYAHKWCDNLPLRESTVRKTRGVIKNHIEPVWPALQMIEARSSHVQGWVTSRRRLEQPLAASTIRAIYNSIIYPMFKRAAIDRVIPFSPCIDITLPELPDGTYDVPTTLQVSGIATGLGGYYEGAPLTAAGCGLRTGEVFGLELDHLDFLRRKILVRQQLAMNPVGPIYLAPLKTKTSKRDVEMPTVLGERLARHIEQHPPQPVLIWDRTNPDKPKQREARLIWLDPEGRPMEGGRWSKLWRAGIDKAELPPTVYTMRSLRHYFATTLIYAGKNVKTVQMAMGHAKPTITLETYLGYWPDDERDGTRVVLDAAFEVLRDEIYTDSVPGDLVPL
jgi:integrase